MKPGLLTMKITLLTGKTYDLENSFSFPLTVVKSSRSRRMSLRIDSKKRTVVLTLPPRCSVKKAYEFVKEHQDWAEEHLLKLPKMKEFKDGETFSLFTRTLTIRHRENSLRAAEEKDGILYIGGDAAFLHRRVKDYIKKQAEKEFLIRSQKLAEKIGCRVKNVVIKDTSSRWGSCSTLNNINYNWRIALAPACVIDYLVAHEVSHLKHRDHSRDFWRCVKELYSGAALGKSWLKAHGNELYRYR